jgi:uracil-DNA glycosylase
VTGGGRSSRRELPRALAEHRASLGSCVACGLGATRPIVSEAVNPRVMLVGQAPGKVEESGGRPFAGRAGKTLFRWFAVAGLDEVTIRERVYIAAVTRCYPGPSPSGRGDRVPSLEERERCSHWLDAELAILRPRLIIPVGRLAIDRFLGPIPLDQVIGRVHVVEQPGSEQRLIPLPHPSGASSWTYVPANRRLLDRALTLIGDELRRLGIGGRRGRAAS